MHCWHEGYRTRRTSKRWGGGLGGVWVRGLEQQYPLQGFHQCLEVSFVRSSVQSLCLLHLLGGPNPNHPSNGKLHLCTSLAYATTDINSIAALCYHASLQNDLLSLLIFVLLCSSQPSLPPFPCSCLVLTTLLCGPPCPPRSRSSLTTSATDAASRLSGG